MTAEQRRADRIAPLVTRTVRAGKYRHQAAAPRDWSENVIDGIGVNLIPAAEPTHWRNPVVWASIAVIVVCAIIAVAIFASKVAGA